MRYYKVTDNGYIISVGTGAGGAEITETEYQSILSIIKTRPEGNYALKEDLTWEEMPEPEVPTGDEELTSDEIAEALEGIL